MKQIPNQVFNDLKRILPILAGLTDLNTDNKIVNAGRLARKYAKKLNKL